MTPDLIIELFKYYAKFVPKDVLKKIFVQPASSRFPGYDEIRTEIMSLPDGQVLPDFDTFVVSLNDNFVSERMKGSKEFVLFVEYGSFSVDHSITEGAKENLAVAVVRKFSDSNSDNVNEIIHMNKCFVLLDTILGAMGDEQNTLDFCDGSLVEFPAELYPVDPALFHGCGGWVAKFKKVNTIL
ncbi:MAG TPA: hypothetical protein DEQ30_02905 [Porphyromonadaceae bacterium]|nr:hypothetical protein [Porphyromonadaceae bacterium]